MNHTPIVIALVCLIVLLAGIGAWTHDAAITTMAAGTITGLFAYLQVRTKD